MDPGFGILEAKTNRRRARRKRDKRLMLRNAVEWPSQNFGVKKRITKSARRRLKISRQCLNSFIQGVYGETLNINEEKHIVRYRYSETELVEQTIDLCDSSGSALETSSSHATQVPSNHQPVEVVDIDLSNDFSEQREVIDLTEADNLPPSDCQATTSSQPTVIDISDEATPEPNPKSDGKEVFVIGTFTSHSSVNPPKNSSLVPLSPKSNNFNSLVICSDKLKRKYSQKSSVFDRNENKKRAQCRRILSQSQGNLARIGGNVYVNSPLPLPSSGLRPIIIDGSNVAFVHSGCNFSCKRLEICINYFKEKGHEVTAFVPQFRLKPCKSDNPELLRKLEKIGNVVLTPSKKIDGKSIVPYDDRYIVQAAVLKGGVIITRDNYNDLLKENPSWAETIKYRTLAFTWVDDVLMFPKDPLGEFGPSLEDFLRFH